MAPLLLVPEGEEGSERVALIPEGRQLCLGVKEGVARLTVPAPVEALRTAVDWIAERAERPYKACSGPSEQAVHLKDIEQCNLDELDRQFLFGPKGVAKPPLGSSPLLVGVLRTADALGCKWLRDL
eukprot:Hpha_TRINITY_DN37269_c0_g1::TRINITY_DN37269_c0_g1_i1::g.85227::m.85227